MERSEDQIVCFNREQASKCANVSPPTLDEWLRREDFPAFRAGRRWIIPREPFMRWLEEMAAKRARL